MFIKPLGLEGGGIAYTLPPDCSRVACSVAPDLMRSRYQQSEVWQLFSFQVSGSESFESLLFSTERPLSDWKGASIEKPVDVLQSASAFEAARRSDLPPHHAPRWHSISGNSGQTCVGVIESCADTGCVASEFKRAPLL